MSLVIRRYLLTIPIVSLFFSACANNVKSTPVIVSTAPSNSSPVAGENLPDDSNKEISSASTSTSDSNDYGFTTTPEGSMVVEVTQDPMETNDDQEIPFEVSDDVLKIIGLIDISEARVTKFNEGYYRVTGKVVGVDFSKDITTGEWEYEYTFYNVERVWDNGFTNVRVAGEFVPVQFSVDVTAGTGDNPIKSADFGDGGELSVARGLLNWVWEKGKDDEYLGIGLDEVVEKVKAGELDPSVLTVMVPLEDVSTKNIFYEGKEYLYSPGLFWKDTKLTLFPQLVNGQMKNAVNGVEVVYIDGAKVDFEGVLLFDNHSKTVSEVERVYYAGYNLFLDPRTGVLTLLVSTNHYAPVGWSSSVMMAEIVNTVGVVLEEDGGRAIDAFGPHLGPWLSAANKR